MREAKKVNASMGDEKKRKDRKEKFHWKATTIDSKKIIDRDKGSRGRQNLWDMRSLLEFEKSNLSMRTWAVGLAACI